MPEAVSVLVYRLDELGARAKETARAWFRDSQIADDWHDAAYEDFQRICEILGVALKTRVVPLNRGGSRQDPCIYFSGFSNQGDGACYEADYAYRRGSAAEIRTYAPKDDELHRIADALMALQRLNFYRLHAEIRHRGRYYHEYCMTVSVERRTRQSHDIPGLDTEEAVIGVLRDLARWLYRQLQREYDYLTSDDAVDEAVRENDYTFTEDGRRFSIGRRHAAAGEVRIQTGSISLTPRSARLPTATGRIRVVIPTTEGPSTVLRVTAEHPDLRSAVCLGRSTTMLPISQAYDAFVRRPTGVVERATGHPVYRIDVSAPIEEGSSWQLGVYIAHCLKAAGRLAEDDAPADFVLWTSGVVDADLRILPVGRMAEKLHRSIGLLEAAGDRLLVAVPRDQAGEVESTSASANLIALDAVEPLLQRLGFEPVGCPAGAPRRTLFEHLAAVLGTAGALAAAMALPAL